ncbi:MAG: sigma-70 family RNA polymerase sigma factor [Verrucomicrobiales bacterium]|nr:sigma-70 family RNA polymerase sigma factor [Verrucomicrobiales bacterium]
MDSQKENASYEQFVTFFTRSEPALRAFIRSLLPSWDDANEVMQNTSLVLWRKFDTFDQNTEFLKWAFVVARFEVLKYRRSIARDRHVFDEDLINRLATEAAEESDHLQAERRALQACLSKLPATQQDLIKAAYQPGIKIKELAEKIGKTATALYKSLNRTRQQLLVCIERSIAQEKSLPPSQS